MFHPKHLLLSALATASLAGCVDAVDPADDPSAAGVFAEGDASTLDVDGITAEVIAAVPVGERKVEFIREPDGAIAVVAVGDAAAIAQDLLEAQGATTLEAFLALSPDEPPAALVAAHDAEARARDGEARAPRALVARPAVVLNGFGDCNASEWDDWHAAQTVSYDGRASQFRSHRGDVDYVAYINGDWSARRFDACGGANVFSPIDAIIQWRSSSTASWSTSLRQSFVSTQRFYYFTLSTTRYRRMLLSKPATGHTNSYGVGGAWQEPLGVVL